MENRASYIFVGAFVLIFVAATIGMAVWLAGVDFDEAPKQYTINFEGDVTGLSVGSPVRYRGVPVGSVSAIDIAPENVERVKVIIDVSRDTPIKTDTVAQLALQGITGVAFVQLTGGTHAAPVLAPDRKNKAPVIASRPSALQQLVNRLPEIVEKVDRISGSLVKLFDDKNIAALSSTLENIERASSMMGKESDQISSLLREGRAAVEAMKTAGQSISVLARTLDRETKPLSSDLSASLKEFRHTMTTLRQGIGTLDRVAGDIASVVDNSKGPLQDFTNSGLYEFSTFFSEARILVDSMTRLVDRMERDPAQFFFGDSQRGLRLNDFDRLTCARRDCTGAARIRVRRPAVQSSPGGTLCPVAQKYVRPIAARGDMAAFDRRSDRRGGHQHVAHRGPAYTAPAQLFRRSELVRHRAAHDPDADGRKLREQRAHYRRRAAEYFTPRRLQSRNRVTRVSG